MVSVNDEWETVDSNKAQLTIRATLFQIKCQSSLLNQWDTFLKHKKWLLKIRRLFN